MCVIDSGLRWPDSEIPYEIESAFTDEEASHIDEAVKEFAKVSCVTVRPRRPSDKDYVFVTGDDTGCWSWVGRLRGLQALNLQRSSCCWRRDIVHEFLHAAGLYHEQNRYDRGNYVTILWENIIHGMESNFDKMDTHCITSYGQPYDYGSVMHYPETAFSSNGLPTLRPHNASWVGKVGLAEVMSDIDITKLKIMYQC